MRRIRTIIVLVVLAVGSLAAAQNGDNPAFDSVTFPVFSLNPAPVPGASIALVGQPGQAMWYFWASANYQLGSVVSYLGSVSNAPNTLSGSNYISIIPTAYPAGLLNVDILATTGPLAPVGACNCAIATGLTSGGTNFQSNTLSSYSVSILNPQAFNLRLTNEVTGTGAVSLVLRNAYTGALICIVSAGCGGGSGVPITTVAGLASVAGKTNGTIAVVTDGNSLTDCTVGGGSTNVLCQYNGTSWYAIVTAGTPGGSDAQLQFNHLGVFAGIANVAPGSLLASTGTISPPAPQLKLPVDMRDGVNGQPGVKCDGSTDDTAAFQNYFTYYGKGGAGAANVQFQLPIGNCILSSEVVYEGTNSLGMNLVGQNGFTGDAQPATDIQWHGPNFGTEMLILGCNGCQVRNVTFTANDAFQSGGQAQNALWFDSSDSVTQVTYNLSSIARSANVVTATTTTTHTITPGRIVKIAGSTGGTTSFNGTFQVLYSNSNTTVSWVQTGANESGTGLTGTVTNYHSTPSNDIKIEHVKSSAGVAVQSSISAISGTNPTAVTTSTPHFIQNNDTVCLRGVTDTSYIGCYIAQPTSSTTANLTVLAYTGVSPSGTASSGGTLLSGSSGLRFSHADSATPQVAAVYANDIFVQGDQLGGTANCIESDNQGNTKDFVFINPQFDGCRYGFNGFNSGNFNVVGMGGTEVTSDTTKPTLATSEFVNIGGEVTVTGGEFEPPYGRLFLGTGTIHFDGASFQGAAPTDDQIIRWSGQLNLTSSLFQNGRASNANTILAFECSPNLTSGTCSLHSVGNAYANAASGGSWSNAPYLPVEDSSGNLLFVCPGTYCNQNVNVQSLGDLGSRQNYFTNQTPLNNIVSGSLITASNSIQLLTPTPATSSVNSNSPCLYWDSSFWNSGATSNIWTACDDLTSGPTPLSVLTFSQSGSPAPAAVQFPGVLINSGALAGIYEDSLGTLDFGNGQPYDFSGAVQLSQINFHGISGNLSSFVSTPVNGTRNDKTQAEGMAFTVNRAITVSQLGRKYLSGNTQNHAINLWISTNQVTPIASGTVLAASTSDSFGVKWVSITPVTLTPGNSYVIGIDETNGGDTWQDHFAYSLQPQIINTWTAEGPTSSFPVASYPQAQMYDTPGLTFTTAVPTSTITSTAGVPSGNCVIGSIDSNSAATSASTVLYVCYPADTWNAVTVP